MVYLSDSTALQKNRLNHLVSVIQNQIFQVSKTVSLPFEEAFDLANKLKEYEILATLHIHHAKFFQQIGEYDSAWKEIEKARDLYAKSNDQRGKADIFNRFAVLEYLKGNYQKAFSLSEEGLKIGEKHNHSKGIIDSLNLMGSIYKEQGKFDKALGLFFTALKINTLYALPYKCNLVLAPSF